jgi:predicted ATPase
VLALEDPVAVQRRHRLDKSTPLEAIAEAYGIDVRGGHGARRYGSYLDKGPLGSVLRLSRTAAGRRFTGRNAKGFFLRAETAFGVWRT